MAKSSACKEYEKMKHLCAQASRQIREGVPANSAMSNVGATTFGTFGDLRNAKRQAFAVYEPEMLKDRKASEAKTQEEQKDNILKMRSEAQERRKEMAKGLSPVR